MMTWDPPTVTRVKFKGKKADLVVGESEVTALKFVGENHKFIQVMKGDECYVEIFSDGDKAFLDGEFTQKSM